MDGVVLDDGLLQSIFPKKKLNAISIKLNSDDTEDVKFRISEDHELPRDIEEFLSCPEGGSHIASLMQFMDCSKQQNGVTGKHESGICNPMLSREVSCNKLTMDDEFFEKSQGDRNSHLNPTAQKSSDDSAKPSQAQEGNLGNQPPCDDQGAALDMDGTSADDLVHFIEQIYSEQEDGDSGSTEIIASQNQAANSGRGTPAVSALGTEDEKQAVEVVGTAGDVFAPSSQVKKRKQKNQACGDVKGVSKKSKTSSYNKKEANKSYRLAHRNAHIVAERLRRKQMNEHFSALKDIIPSSYIPRVDDRKLQGNNFGINDVFQTKLDQATILAAAVNLVRDLEHLVKRLQDQKNQASLSVSPCNSSLVAESHSHESPISTIQSTSADVPWIDVESGLYGQLHANLKSSAGEVEVQITQNDVSVTIYTLRKRKNQVILLLEVFQDLQLILSHLSISTDGNQALYKLQAEV
ncbi:hypothetical protein AXG93_2752s1980 [Marchantia polymorpha subsp. ruderalis]|uniref:BHLH domain-containing protein n=1 Tax=Marchantia polymorpha subsp. ruderalis TaxID=1480154 RepID=A0A176VV64_MARPO|nr:hypothetical protein AXG93_2752s1980 [Marchantia polymorpha subsp. ruderalis]